MYTDTSIILAVRRSRCELVRTQLSCVLDVCSEDILKDDTAYSGIILLFMDGRLNCAPHSIRNIEALLLNKVQALGLQSPVTSEDKFSFRSLANVDEREQYDYLSQLLYLDKALKNKK